jgi:glycosyltransferase involved in cell wall biosynthesis
MRLDDAPHMVSGGSVRSNDAGARPLRIVHCFRAPVGGLFRHVRDLAETQAKAGHRVGIIADSSTGGDKAEAAFEALKPFLALGLHRIPMRREISPSDIAAVWRLAREVRSLHPDVLHAHGAKGGAYARTIGTFLRATGTRVARIYTPHGGSLHFDPKSMKGRIVFASERMLAWMTDAFVFVSQFEADTYVAKVGKPRAPMTVALNGLRSEEFEPVIAAMDARDFLFIGEIRALKGPDLFIEALALMARQTGRGPTAVIVGDGPDKPNAMALVAERGLGAAITFRDAMPARQAFSLARAVVVPSRAESLPYIVLEAIAAGLPMVVTRVGGIPEIYGDASASLVQPDDAAALAAAMTRVTSDLPAAKTAAARLRESVRQRFSVAAMAATIEGAYREVAAR